MKITMVEDNLGDILLTEDTLEEMGLEFQLTTFKDGESAIHYFKKIAKEKLDDLPLDLVILDINLPQKSGIEILEFIREQIPNAKFKVVFLTSSNARQDLEKIKGLKADAHFLKPLDPDEFLNFLKITEVRMT